MIWRPYVQMKNMPSPHEVFGGKGVWLDTSDGRVIDSISSWWCMIHGYNHPRIVAAIQEQAGKLSHVMFGGLTHEPAERLSAKLETFLPGDLDCFFYCDNGSSGVEVALTITSQYYQNRGERGRTRVLALEHAHHGNGYTEQTLAGQADFVAIPTTISALESAFERDGERLHSFIVEPLLQGGGGMRFYDVSFLRRARELCDEYGVLLVFDEVATGLGRTGNRFVSDLVLPDVCVLGKALPGGHISFAATAARRHVFEAFLGESSDLALAYGPTFMGNPLGCAAALASIELFEEEDYMSKIRRIESITRRELASLVGRSHEDPRILDVRVLGGCACVEVDDPATLKGYHEFAFERGVFARPFGTCLYSMVPYVIEEEELVRVYDVMKDWFDR